MTADEARAALVDYLRSHGHGKFVDDCIADLVQATKAEGWDEGAGDRDQWRISGEAGPAPRNPYRADDEEDGS